MNAGRTAFFRLAPKCFGLSVNFTGSATTTFLYELTIWIHRLNLVAMILVFIHVQLIGYITAITPFMWWFDGASLVVAASYLWAKLGAPRTWQTGTLIGNRAISPNVQELTIQLPRTWRRSRFPGGYQRCPWTRQSRLMVAMADIRRS